MKRENIHVGMRVKVKQSCSIVAWRGKYATVIGKPCDGLEKYAACLFEGVDEGQVLHIKDIKISDEKPVVGDRIILLGGEGDWDYYEVVSSGLLSRIDWGGDYWVKFDSGQYRNYGDHTWRVGHVNRKIAIIRSVEGVK